MGIPALAADQLGVARQLTPTDPVERGGRGPCGQPSSGGDKLTQDRLQPGWLDLARVAQVDLVALPDHREASAGHELMVNPLQQLGFVVI